MSVDAVQPGTRASRFRTPRMAAERPRAFEIAAPWLFTLALFLVKCGLPRAMPYFFGSLKVAITLAFVGTAISEMLGANEGLGQMLLTAQANFEVPLVFAVLIALAIEGIVMYAIFATIEQRMVGWAFRGSHAA